MGTETDRRGRWRKTGLSHPDYTDSRKAGRRPEDGRGGSLRRRRAFADHAARPEVNWTPILGPLDRGVFVKALPHFN